MAWGGETGNDVGIDPTNRGTDSTACKLTVCHGKRVEADAGEERFRLAGYKRDHPRGNARETFVEYRNMRHDEYFI